MGMAMGVGAWDGILLLWLELLCGSFNKADITGYPMSLFCVSFYKADITGYPMLLFCVSG
jgi:hypothetical protein